MKYRETLGWQGKGEKRGARNSRSAAADYYVLYGGVRARGGKRERESTSKFWPSGHGLYGRRVAKRDVPNSFCRPYELLSRRGALNEARFRDDRAVSSTRSSISVDGPEIGGIWRCRDEN